MKTRILSHSIITTFVDVDDEGEFVAKGTVTAEPVEVLGAGGLLGYSEQVEKFASDRTDAANGKPAGRGE